MAVGQDKRERGEGGIFKTAKSRFWYIQYYQNGRQIRISSGTEVKDKARTILRKLMGERDKGALAVSDVRRLRYADLRAILTDHYIAEGKKSLREKSDGSDSIPGLTALDEFCGFERGVVDGKFTVTNPGVPALSLTTDFARDFVRRRKAEGVGNAAINRSLSCLRRMLTLAKKERKLADVPHIQFQKEPSARKGFLEPEKFVELVKLLPTHLKPLVIFLYDTGVRIGEALQVEWRQVDLGARTVTLEDEQTKNSEARTIPILSELHHLLEQVPEAQREGLLFNNDNPICSAVNLRKEWAKACVLAGLGTVTEVEGRPYDPVYSGLTLHDLRRSAIRNLIRSGQSETVARKISGHKTSSVFQRYNITSTEDVLNAAQAVEQYRLRRLASKTVEGEVSRKPARKALTARTR